MRYSELARYLKCGLSLKFTYELKHARTNVPLSQGIAVARAAREDNLCRMEREVWLPESDVVDVAVAGFEEECATKEVMNATEKDLGKGKDTTASIARIWCLDVRQGIWDLVAVEQRIAGKIGSVWLTGTPDYVLKQGIGDLKTGKAWTQCQADRSRQLTIYSKLYEDTYGVRPGKLWIDSIASRRKEIGYERIYTTREEVDFAALVNLTEAAMDGIRRGIWLPAAEGAWWCSPKYCEHWLKCEAVIGRNAIDDGE